MTRARGTATALALVLLAVATVLLASSCGREAPPRAEAPAPVPAPRDSTPPRAADPGRPAPEAPASLLSADELHVLQEQGLTDPVPQLVASLRAHPEVIPHAGVLGGTMGFYVPEDIHVLNARTVFALFTDGHIDGSGVFEFTVEPGGGIVWRALSSRIHGSPAAGPAPGGRGPS